MFFRLAKENTTASDKKLGIRKEMFRHAPYVLLKMEEKDGLSEVMVTWVSEQQVKDENNEKKMSTELTDGFLDGLPENCERVSRKYYTERVTSS